MTKLLAKIELYFLSGLVAIGVGISNIIFVSVTSFHEKTQEKTPGNEIFNTFVERICWRAIQRG